MVSHFRASRTIMARGIPTGPDEDVGELRSVIIGALALRKSGSQS